MSIKDDVDYVKNELSSEEKFLENFVKGERFFKKYKIIIFSVIALAIITPIGIIIKDSIDEKNKFEANLAFNKVLENFNDEKALKELKEKNLTLYEVALFLEAKKKNKEISISVPILKELSQYQEALIKKEIKTLDNLSMQNDFILKEFAVFNKALLLTNDGKFEEAKTALKLIPQTSKAFELANLLNHYLLTK